MQGALLQWVHGFSGWTDPNDKIIDEPSPFSLPRPLPSKLVLSAEQEKIARENKKQYEIKANSDQAKLCSSIGAYPRFITQDASIHEMYRTLGNDFPADKTKNEFLEELNNMIRVMTLAKVTQSIAEEKNQAFVDFGIRAGELEFLKKVSTYLNNAKEETLHSYSESEWARA